MLDVRRVRLWCWVKISHCTADRLGIMSGEIQEVRRSLTTCTSEGHAEGGVSIGGYDGDEDRRTRESGPEIESIPKNTESFCRKLR
jgi:hypothetical protein